jgi:hypothetical protein
MRRGLQIFLAVLGAISVVAGASALLAGASQVIGERAVSNNVDSEFRFFAAWYVVAGVLLLRAIPGVEREGPTIRLIAAGLLLAAVGRVLSLASVGTPHSWYIVLMGIEFVLPVVIVPWQLAVSGRTVGAH